MTCIVLSAVVGWELDLIGPDLVKLAGVKYGERRDNEGYTSKWLFELSDWFTKCDFKGVGLLLGYSGEWESDGKHLVGFEIYFDYLESWLWDISGDMQQFIQYCSSKGLELPSPELFEFCEDYGFGPAEDMFERKLTPEEKENERIAKVNKGIERLKDKNDDERHWVIHQSPFDNNPEIYSLCKELLREPDERFWHQLGNGTDYGLGLSFLGELLPEMIFGLKSESVSIRQCSKLYLSEYISDKYNHEAYRYVNAELKKFEVDALKEILQLEIPSQKMIYRVYYEEQLDSINKLISEIID